MLVIGLCYQANVRNSDFELQRIPKSFFSKSKSNTFTCAAILLSSSMFSFHVKVLRLKQTLPKSSIEFIHFQCSLICTYTFLNVADIKSRSSVNLVWIDACFSKDAFKKKVAPNKISLNLYVFSSLWGLLVRSLSLKNSCRISVLLVESNLQKGLFNVSCIDTPFKTES